MRTDGLAEGCRQDQLSRPVEDHKGDVRRVLFFPNFSSWGCRETPNNVVVCSDNNCEAPPHGCDVWASATPIAGWVLQELTTNA